MTASRPGGRPSSSNKMSPPTSRRSARQQRLANRQANRALERAGTRSSGPTRGTILIAITSIALFAAVVVIAFAFMSTQKATAPVGSPMPPGFTTPPDIARNGTTLGNPDAPVTLDLYSDYQCPRCFDFAKVTEVKLIDKYVRGGKLKIVYHDLVIIDGYPGGTTESRDAANAALCASDQGKFWVMHDWLFGNQSLKENGGAFTQDRLIEIGRLAGLGMAKFEPCVRNVTHKSDIAAEGSAKPSGIGGTPAIFLNKTQIQGPPDPSTGDPTIPSYELIASAIDAILNPAPSTSPSASPSASASASASPTAAPTSSASGSASPVASPTAVPSASPS